MSLPILLHTTVVFENTYYSIMLFLLSYPQGVYSKKNNLSSSLQRRSLCAGYLRGKC